MGQIVLSLARRLSTDFAPVNIMFPGVFESACLLAAAVGIVTARNGRSVDAGRALYLEAANRMFDAAVDAEKVATAQAKDAKIPEPTAAQAEALGAELFGQAKKEPRPG